MQPAPQEHDQQYDERLAELADLVLTVGRAVRTAAAGDPSLVELSLTEVTVMHYIDHHAGVSPSTVAVATGLQRSNLSRALRELEAKGMVERTADPADQRQALLRGTPKAAENLTRVRASWARQLGNALDASGQEYDIASALELLRALDQGLHRRLGRDRWSTNFVAQKVESAGRHRKREDCSSSAAEAGQ
ncbi:MAG: MarR family transcriptional regulator [Actinomycetia bacterium]|nr:MarR family transcriptional regulator [Actinomycetes bacterium]